jgi:hypothetical protein
MNFTEQNPKKVVTKAAVLHINAGGNDILKNGVKSSRLSYRDTINMLESSIPADNDGRICNNTDISV